MRSILTPEMRSSSDTPTQGQKAQNMHGSSNCASLHSTRSIYLTEYEAESRAVGLDSAPHLRTEMTGICRNRAQRGAGSQICTLIGALSRSSIIIAASLTPLP